MSFFYRHTGKSEGCGGNLGIQKDSVLERCYEQ